MNQNEFTVGLDVDGILRNWVQTILLHINSLYGTRIFNNHISSYDLVPIIQKEVPGFDHATLEGIHKRCAETGKLAEASSYKDALNLFYIIHEAGFPIRLVTYQPDFAKESFYKWITAFHLSDRIAGIDFLKPEDKVKANVQLLIDDNPIVIQAAAKSQKPSILWQRRWNRDWRYEGNDIPEDMIRYTVIPKQALRFIEYWEEKIGEGI